MGKDFALISRPRCCCAERSKTLQSLLPHKAKELICTPFWGMSCSLGEYPGGVHGWKNVLPQCTSPCGKFPRKFRLPRPLPTGPETRYCEGKRHGKRQSASKAAAEDLKNLNALVWDLAVALINMVGSCVPKVGSRCVHVPLPGILNVLVWDLAPSRFQTVGLTVPKVNI